MKTVHDVMSFLERFAPLDLAAEWDNVGLLLGSRAAPVQRVLTCLTVTPESAAEAIARDVQLIVSHHPILFKPIQKLTEASTEGRMLLDLARANVAIFSPHTAFDNTQGGINDLLCRHLQLSDVLPLRPLPSAESFKVVVFVPERDLQPVSEAMFAAGAGHIGAYRECSFRSPGTGTFFGTETTSPRVGEKGRHEEVAETRLEMRCSAKVVSEVLAAARRAHSYEEPAMDVYPLKSTTSERGEGRIGRKDGGTLLHTLIDTAKAALKITGPVQLIGDAGRRVERVAVACGAAASFLEDAARQRVDLFVTGEARFHDCLAARGLGVALLLLGHYASERCGVEDLARRLQAEFSDLEVIASTAETEPIAWI